MKTVSKTTAIKKCSCAHEFQDKLYGLGMRLMNAITNNTKYGNWRCTVCGKAHQ